MVYKRGQGLLIPFVNIPFASIEAAKDEAANRAVLIRSVTQTLE
jgi:hypothetical protein